MTVSKQRRRPSNFHMDADKAARRYFSGWTLESALADIQLHRMESILPDFWDDVESKVRAHFIEIERKDAEVEEYYIRELSEQDRVAANRIAKDLCLDMSWAFREVGEHIKTAKTARDKRFWSYVRRLLNKMKGRGTL